MRRKHNLCCIASVKLKQQSLGLELAQIGGQRWRQLAKVSESANGGEERY